MEGWLGKVKFEELVCHDDDLHGLIESLEKKQGAVLIGSHLGNIELLRSLSSFNRTGVKREVPVTVIMETKSTEQFNNTLKEVNPNAGLHIISPQSIGPDTMILLQEHIQNGGLVVFAADRTSASARTRSVRLPFLGKAADFPYGVFLLTLLLNAPTYFVFALRTKTASLHPRYNMFVERAETPLAGFRAERDKRIHALCEEYVGKLEKYCKLFPYQWYNFYNFWLLPDSNGGGVINRFPAAASAGNQSVFLWDDGNGENSCSGGASVQSGILRCRYNGCCVARKLCKIYGSGPLRSA